MGRKSNRSIPEKIVAFLNGGKPGAFCDDCIRAGLGLPRRQEVAIVTLTLSLTREFHREVGNYVGRHHKGGEKLVTSAA